MFHLQQVSKWSFRDGFERSAYDGHPVRSAVTPNRVTTRQFDALKGLRGGCAWPVGSGNGQRRVWIAYGNCQTLASRRT